MLQEAMRAQPNQAHAFEWHQRCARGAFSQSTSELE